jgi:DNA-binding Lrp family transcriptional regulator
MRIRKKYLFYVLAFTSALLGAIVAGVDATISTLFIPDPWAFGFSVFLVGAGVTLVLSLFLSIPFKEGSIGGKAIDPSFKRLRLLQKDEIKYHILAGLGNASLTVGYFALLSILGDPSVVLPFTQIVILYLLVVESVTEKNIPTLPEVQSSVIVTFGAIIGSISLSGAINVEPLVIVFLVINPAWVVFSIYQRKLKLLKIGGKPNDAINIRFWNVVFSCLFTALLVGVFDVVQGTGHFLAGIIASVEYFPWIVLTMGITFFSFVFYIRALGMGKASVTQAIRASMIIFAIPVSLFLSSLNIIPLFSLEPTLLLMKTIGIVLILLGIVSFALTLVKAYVFITVKPGYRIEETMDKLWRIRGVNRVTATAGRYDFIIKIHIRTLVKGYERIIRKLEGIEEIDEYRWQSVLKEWEEI